MSKESFYSVDGAVAPVTQVLGNLDVIVNSERIDLPIGEPVPVAGAKHDQGKVQWGLLMGGCGLALAQIVKVLMFGAKKYAPGAWQSVPNGYQRYKDALYRHLHSVEENGPLVLDEETGLLELAHCGCCILFMIWLAVKGKVT